MEYYLDSEGQGKRDKGARHLVPPPSRPKTGVEPATARTEVWAPRHVVASAKIVRGGEEGLLFCSRSQLFRQRVRGIHSASVCRVVASALAFFAPSRRPVRLPSRPLFMNPYSPFDPTTPTLTNEQSTLPNKLTTRVLDPGAGHADRPTMLPTDRSTYIRIYLPTCLPPQSYLKCPRPWYLPFSHPPV